MDQVNQYVQQAIQALQSGFGSVNQPAGLVIALVAAILLSSWRNWIPMSLLATIVLVIVNNISVFQSGHLPNFTQPEFWTKAVAYLLGYLIIIGVFFFLKSMVFRSGKAAAH